MNRYIIKILLLGISFFSYVLCSSPQQGHPKNLSQYSHQVWEAENGLPQNSISAITQTHDGYLWLGTLEGLVRFDGVRFTVFDVGNTGALESNRIVSLYEDHQNNLWIGTEGGGVTRMSNGKFTTFTTTEGLFSNSTGQICEDREGTIWIVHREGITQYKNGNFYQISPSSGLPGHFYGPICTGYDGTVWIGSDTGLIQYSGTSFHISSLHQGIKFNDFFSLRPGNDGAIWIGTGHGLARFQNDAFTVWTTKDGLPTDFVWSLWVQRNGNLLIGTQGGGACLFDGNRFTTFSSVNGLSNDVVWSVFEDREGLIWIGTNGGGLNRLKDALFTSFTEVEGLANDFVWSVCQAPNGDFWFGTYDGLTRYSNGKFQSFTTRDGLSSNFIWSVYADYTGDVWIGTANGLNVFANGKIKTVTISDGMGIVSVRSILKDREGTLWVGTTEGLRKLPPGVNQRFVTVESKEVLKNAIIMSLCESRDGSLWLGTGNGLYHYDHETFQLYTVMEGLSNNIIRSLYEDPAGNLWIGTQGGGLSLYRSGKFSRITQRYGLFNDVVSQILEDVEGNLWMGCNKGIFRVAKEELINFADGKIRTVHSVSYGKDDGMRSAECNGSSQPAGWRAVDGTLWFPTIKGVAVINPQQKEVRTLVPPVLIESTRVNKQPISAFDPLNIPVGSGEVEFDYTALMYYAPEKITFSYKLDGYDSEWKNVGTRRTAFYTNLSPGTYTFWVTTVVHDTLRNGPVASIHFRLLPHFYQEWWFFGLCSIFVLALLYSGYRIKMNQAKRREQRLVRLVDERTMNLLIEKENAEKARIEAEKLQRFAEDANNVKSEILHIAAHDMKSPLISIKMYAQIIASESGGQMGEFADDIYTNSQRMLELINELLDSSAIENGKITLHKVRLNISRVTESAAVTNAKMAEKKGQHIHTETEPDCFIEGDENRIRQVLDNLISNAMKFSPSETSIWIKVFRFDSQIRISVRDEGPGMTDDDKKRVFGKFQRLSARPTGGEPSTGLGLSVVRHLVEIQQGKVWVESERGKGCTFFVEFTASDAADIQKASKE